MSEERMIRGPERGEYKKHPVLSIPLLDGKNKEGHPFTFGLRKATAIVSFYDEIKEFVEDEASLKGGSQ